MEGEQHVITYQARSLAQLSASAGLTARAHQTLFVAAPWLAGIGWSLAERAHRAEQRLHVPFGALLVQTFEQSPLKERAGDPARAATG